MILNILKFIYHLKKKFKIKIYFTTSLDNSNSNYYQYNGITKGLFPFYLLGMCKSSKKIGSR